MRRARPVVPRLLLPAALLLPATLPSVAAPPASPGPDDPAVWSIHVLNDNCPDYTWGLDEQQTRKAFADIVRSHLDEMKRTDGEPPESRDRYNMAVTQEAICFLERYPERADELTLRVKEGRVYVSPFLCNTLWGFHSTEAALRAMYPARRLAAQWGVPLDCAHHIEEPSLPWGMATILAGSGIRWLLVPFYDFDSTFAGLKNPPVFHYEGPDGSRIKVIMDPWLCRKASYAQGAAAIKEGGSLASWVAHYRGLGADYPLSVILASGTHSDISPASGNQARGFADGIIRHNAEAKGQPRLVNSTLPMFCKAADAAALPVVRGCFGHSWDLWPVSLAKYAAAMREGERKLLAHEAFIAVVGLKTPTLLRYGLVVQREAAEALAMLSDHAWNGTDANNRKENARLRRAWADALGEAVQSIWIGPWHEASAPEGRSELGLFNPTSVPRKGLAWCFNSKADLPVLKDKDRTLPVQCIKEEDVSRVYFVTPQVPGFSLSRISVQEGDPGAAPPPLQAGPTTLEGPFYRLTVDATAGGVTSLIHKPSGRELVRPGRVLGRTVFHDGTDHALTDVAVTVDAVGPVLARLRLAGIVSGIACTTCITIYGELDQVDFDFRIRKPVTSVPQRLCHVFPLLDEKAVLRVETPAAVVRPQPQPEGDLLPGADTRRIAAQGFVDVAGASAGATIAPLDAFCLRLDLEGVTFEALGNDQNHKEVTQDQGGETEFRFRYALRGRGGAYDPAAAVAFGRAASMPLMCQPCVAGYKDGFDRPPVVVPPDRAIATCLKPADDPKAGGVILRIWETAGKDGPVPIGVHGFKRAIACDLLERDVEDVPVQDGMIRLKVKPYGLAAVRLIP